MPAERPRYGVGAPLILLALVIIVWLPRFRGPIDLRWDAAVYYTLGTSLAENKGYRLLNEPGEIKATQYPPLLPAFVAAHQLVLGTSDPTVVGRGLRLSFFLLFAMYILTVYALARNELPLGYAFATALVCLFNAYTCFLSDSCFPEIAFALLTLLFVLCHIRGGRSFSILAAVLALAAYALRTVGVSMIAAWVIEGLLKKQLKVASLRLVLLIAAIAGWQSYIHYVETESTYARPAYEYQRADYLFYNVSYSRNLLQRDPFSAGSDQVSSVDLMHRALGNLIQLPTRLGVAVTSDKYFWDAQWTALNTQLGFRLVPAWTIDAALILLASLILLGVGLQLKRQPVIPLYVLLSVLSLSVAPWPEQFTRYFAPLTPFLALLLFLALRTVPGFFGRVAPPRRRLIETALAGSVLSMILVEDALTFVMMYWKMHQNVTYVDQRGERLTYRLFFYKDAYRALDAGLDWLKQRSNPDNVVASSMPHWTYLRTGLKAVMPPFETDPVRAQHLLDSLPVTFIVQDRGLDLDTRKYLSPVVQRFPERWRLVYHDVINEAPGRKPSETFEIYQRVVP